MVYHAELLCEGHRETKCAKLLRQDILVCDVPS